MHLAAESIPVAEKRGAVHSFKNVPVLLNCASYMDPYMVLIIVCYERNGVFLPLSLIAFICTDYVVVFYTEPRLVLKMY
jgi:hypothetical protein